MTLFRRLLGYRHWRVTIAFDDGSVFQSWHWMKPRNMGDMHVPIIGSRWAGHVVCGFCVEREDVVR